MTSRPQKPLSGGRCPTRWIREPDKARLLARLKTSLFEVFRPETTGTYVLKPNLCSADPSHAGVITDVELTRTVLEYLQDHRASARIVELPPHLRDVDRVFRRSGYERLARRHGVALIDPERTGGFAERGALLPALPFRIARAALESDGVINLPKVKTHRRTYYTGAVKNLVGLTDMRTRHFMHLLGLHRTLVELYRAVGPLVVLNVADAQYAMEGDGPTRGDPVRLDSAVLSPDAVLLDCQIAQQVGLELDRIPYLKTLREAAGVAAVPTPRAVGEPLPRTRLCPIPARGGALDYIKELAITQPALRRVLQRLGVDRLSGRR